MTLADFIKVQRQKKGWSQDHLADAAGLNVRTIQRLENGAKAAPETLLALSSALSCRVADLSSLVLDLRPKGQDLKSKSIISVAVSTILCLLPIAFILSNITYYELNLTWGRSLYPHGFMNGVLTSPIIILGGPLVGLIILISRLISVDWNYQSDSHNSLQITRTLKVSAISIEMNPLLIISVTLILTTIVILVGYALFENLSHMIRQN